METWSDAWLATAIENALVSEPGLEGTRIQVEVQDGVVTLRGIAHRTSQRERAAYVAHGFGGVLELHNEIQVTP